MKRIYLRTIIFFFLVLVTSIEARSLKIATYNVENLFDMQHSGLEYKEYIPGYHKWTKSMLTKKLNHIAEVICDLDADVIGLQEVEDDRVLKQLQEVLKRVGCDYSYRAITHTKQTAIHTALLSKIRIRKKRDIVIYRTGRQRSILEAVLDSDPKLRIFVNHWKSKAGPESARLPYAKALMKRLSSLPNGSEYLILGDFNSDYNEYRNLAPKHNDTAGRTGINHLLKTIREGKMVRWHTLDTGYHYNLWMELPVHARWSHNFYGDKEGIDAILIPASLHNGRGWEYQKGSFSVFKPKYLFGKRGRIKRWEYRHSRHTGKGYSDHLPVYAIFDTGNDTGHSDRKEHSVWKKIMSLFGSSSPVQESVSIQQTVSEKEQAEIRTISEVIAMDSLTSPVRLHSVKVIFKYRDTAIIKQKPEGRAILLYRCAETMKEGYAYDITVYLKKRYKGMDELVDIAVEREIGEKEIKPYFQKFMAGLMADRGAVNEITTGVEGRYRHRKLEVGERALPIYFKKGVKRPEEGSRIRIKRAQIGYYKNHNELVIWRTEDYRILEE